MRDGSRDIGCAWESEERFTARVCRAALMGGRGARTGNGIDAEGGFAKSPRAFNCFPATDGGGGADGGSGAGSERRCERREGRSGQEGGTVERRMTSPPARQSRRGVYAGER